MTTTPSTITITVSQTAAANGTTTFATIQDAVDYAAAHHNVATIHINKGTYHEQVVVDGSQVTQALRIEANNNVTIAAPDGGPAANLDSGAIAAIAAVINGGQVTFDGVSVDGRDLGHTHPNTPYYGFYYENSDGSIQHGKATGLLDPSVLGSQTGRAIFLSGTTGDHTVNVSHMTVTDFAKAGIEASGENITGNIDSNTVTGRGATSQLAQNGIEFVNGAAGTATHNTISGIGYNGDETGAAGILVYDSANVTHVDNNNIKMAVDAGASGAERFHLNAGISFEGDVGAATVAHNTVSGAQGAVAVYGDFGTYNGPGLDLSTNTFTGNYNNYVSYDVDPTNDTNNPDFHLTGTRGADYLVGGAGDDTINGGGGSTANSTGKVDYLDGGDGFDTVDFLGAKAGVHASLLLQDGSTAQATGGAGSVILSSFENISGSAYGDTLTGNGSGVVWGGGGNDTLHSGGDNAILDGGGSTEAGDGAADVGNDVLDGRSSSTDFALRPIEKGPGVFAGYLSAGGGVTVNLGITTAQDTVHAGHDTLIHIDNLIGSDFNDTLTGNSNDNIISGGAGNDVIRGVEGNDTLFGGSGNDQVHGGIGNDSIIGGDGNDSLWGGNGTDAFYFDTGFGNDTIENFHVSQDELDFSESAGRIHHSSVNSGADTLVYDDSGNSVLLKGVSESDFSSVTIHYDQSPPTAPPDYDHHLLIL